MLAQYVENLNHNDINIRLESLKKLMDMVKKGEIKKPEKWGAVNNHIHTTYSFSPYSPAKAIWMAHSAGLAAAGIVDHDTVSGTREFIKAGEIAGIATTIGVECRADFSRTPLRGKRINSPAQRSIAYVVLHGIPHTKIDAIRSFFKPYSEKRNICNRLMVDKLNKLLEPFSIFLSFEEDVVPVSKSDEGGSITERHILFALSCKLIDRFGKREMLLNFLRDSLKIDVNAGAKNYLLNSDNGFYEYDLVHVLKKGLVSAFYIDTMPELPDVSDIIALASKTGAVSAYAYLGDTEDSAAGDKKSQKFEDDYLELLFKVTRELGFNAITYMPSRNNMTQLTRVKALCEKYSFFQISGEDINSPRQPFVCQALKKKEFANLIDATWALIGHEKAVTEDIENGMFSETTINKLPELKDRIALYKNYVTAAQREK